MITITLKYVGNHKVVIIKSENGIKINKLQIFVFRIWNWWSYLVLDKESFYKGIKYLGYFIKPNNYLKEDWWWLLKDIEKRISLWCNHWFSLGGKFILVKSMLENIPVYWLSMAKIPSLVLDRIRSKVFSFLWSRGKEKKKIHLVRWDYLARPKEYGG